MPPAYTHERDTPSTYDLSYDGQTPQRHLINFRITRDNHPITLCALDDPSSPGTSPIFAHGDLLPSNIDAASYADARADTSSSPSPLAIQTASLTEWCIEYSSTDPHLWIRSANVWYRLATPATEYAPVHDVARRRFELCARLFILLTSTDPHHCSFKVLAPLLACPYYAMRAYSEREIVLERDFILAQFRVLRDPAIPPNATFLRDLRAKKPPATTTTSRKHPSASASSPMSSSAPAPAAPAKHNKRESNSVHTPSRGASPNPPPSFGNANGSGPPSPRVAAGGDGDGRSSGRLDAEGEQRLMSRVERAVVTIMKNRLAFPFKQPVDPAADGCPDYLDRIARPMDYGTIKRSLELKRYGVRFERVLDDVRLVTRNCIEYNSAEHEFSRWALTLEHKFETLVRNAEEAEVAAMTKRQATAAGSSGAQTAGGKKRRASDALPPTGKNGSKKMAKSSRKGSKSSLDTQQQQNEQPAQQQQQMSPKSPSIRDDDDVSTGTGTGGGTPTPTTLKRCARADGQGQGCEKMQMTNSKYCSDACGFIVARQRLTEISKSGCNPDAYIRAYITKALVHSRS